MGLVLMDIYDWRYSDALYLLTSWDLNVLKSIFCINHKSQLFANVHKLMNHPEKAKKFYSAARDSFESMVRAKPDDPRLYSALGIA
jgi:hypothetical protein